jgi:hypothetical protein
MVTHDFFWGGGSLIGLVLHGFESVVAEALQARFHKIKGDIKTVPAAGMDQGMERYRIGNTIHIVYGHCADGREYAFIMDP